MRKTNCKTKDTLANAGILDRYWHQRQRLGSKAERSLCLYDCLSVCLSVLMSVQLYACMPVSLYVCILVCLYASMPICR